MKLIGTLKEPLIKKPYLYRIELLERFFQVLDNKELVFVQPNCWTDPMENIIFNARIIKDGVPYEHPVKDKIYAQCWSYDDDSYALWQIYTTKANNEGITKRHPGVRITTHFDRLHHIADMNKGLFYYGMVNYLTKRDLLKLPANEEYVKCLQSENINEEHIKSLLIKRKSYNYEKEIRLLALPESDSIDAKNSRLCRLKIEPSEFISSIRFDPSINHQEFKEYKEQLVEEYGFKATAITKSTLDNKNDLIFRL
ncbi:hypothetical protein FMM05_10270 [Flavobacterium zepuense]|uniref:DUF2971 domain-containing protein n=1 Tax=Flavobacterium zepuense TaxID=2593302 RepID=A0A552V329_9FLAO|nr:hypothetical protein [Flavobacterium zepuense]TRW24874.1 hypothetical protein FMM05_10270 [Flavobacterium zepuense]